MNVTLYRYKGEVKKLHKTLPTSEYDVWNFTNVYLKDGSSVTHPTLLIKATNLKDVNYCFIQEFSRYYFVEIDSISNGLWELKCLVDVLNTNWSEIEDNYAYIERSESGGNPLLEDDAASFENKNTITITDLLTQTQGNKKNTDIYNANNDYNVTISVINDLPIQAYDFAETDFDFSVVPPVTCLSSVRYPEDNGESYYNYTYVTELAKINTALKSIYQETEASFIKSVVVWPFNISCITQTGQTTPQTYTIRLGNTSYGANNVYRPDIFAYDYKTFLDYTFPSAPNFNDREPYTTYEMYIPYVGWRTINIADVEGSRVILTMKVNFENGKGTIYLINVTKDYIIASYDAQIGVVVPISRSNLEELNAQAISNAISMVLGVVGGAVSTTIGVASGNPIAIVGGIMSATSSVAKGVSNHIGMFEKGQSQVRDAYNGLDSRKVYLKVTTKSKIASPTAQMGMPVKKVDLISNCSGFTQAKINKLKDLEYASKWEYDEIIRLFSEGVIV